MCCAGKNADREEFQDWVVVVLCYSDTYWTIGILQPSSMEQSTHKRKYCIWTKMDIEKRKFRQAEYAIMIGSGKTNS